jgi:HPt (histidine-containing phosphotransfer) domain-containing protein
MSESASEELLDAGQIAMLRGLRGGKLWPQLLQNFRDQLAADLPALAAAVGSGDFPAVRGCAHGLKSASLNMGAVRVGEAAAALELAVRGNELARVPELAERLRAVSLRTLPVLEAQH